MVAHALNVLVAGVQCRGAGEDERLDELDARLFQRCLDLFACNLPSVSVCDDDASGVAEKLLEDPAGLLDDATSESDSFGVGGCLESFLDQICHLSSICFMFELSLFG